MPGRKKPKAKADEAAVGYGRPPIASQFKKGQSGNPKGRPRKPKVLSLDPIADQYFGDMLLEEGLRPVAVVENGVATEMPVAKAIVRAMFVEGLRGDTRSQLASLALFKAVQDRVLASRMDAYLKARAFIDREGAKINAARARGLPEPEIWPHPDDIVCDSPVRDVSVNGPQTAEEALNWAVERDRLEDYKVELRALRAELQASPWRAQDLQRQINLLTELCRYIEAIYPDEETRRQPGFDLAASRAAVAGPRRRKSSR